MRNFQKNFAAPEGSTHEQAGKAKPSEPTKRLRDQLAQWMSLPRRTRALAAEKMLGIQMEIAKRMAPFRHDPIQRAPGFRCKFIVLRRKTGELREVVFARHQFNPQTRACNRCGVVRNRRVRSSR